MKTKTLQEPVKLLMHLNGGYSKVVLERTVGLGIADGGIEWDIPTELIPPQLRAIGSRFIVICESISPDEQDEIEDIRRAASRITVKELEEEP